MLLFFGGKFGTEIAFESGGEFTGELAEVVAGANFHPVTQAPSCVTESVRVRR